MSPYYKVARFFYVRPGHSPAQGLYWRSFPVRQSLIGSKGSKSQRPLLEHPMTRLHITSVPAQPPSVRVARILLFILSLAAATLAVAPPAISATYYVDPQSGADTNPGTAAAPWRTIPGTRTTDNTSYLRSQWGSISQSNKIRCGDIVFLRGGTTYSTTTVPNGGAWRIDPDYYTATCTAASPITIRVATAGEWSASTGALAIDGTGITNTSRHYAPSGPCQSGGFCGLVTMEDVSYVTFGGVSAAQRVRLTAVQLQPTGATVGILLHGTGYTSTQGQELQWVEVMNRTPTTPNIGAAIDVGDLGYSIIHDAYIHDWAGAGVDTGLSALHKVAGLGVVNVLVENSGPQVSPSGNFTNDAFNFAADPFDDTQGGAGGVWCINCTARNHYWNGSNSGGCDSSYVDSIVRYRNFQVYGAGRTASTESSRVGLESSGDGCGSKDALPEPTIWLFDSIFYNNYNAGQGRPHGSGTSFMWNTTMFRAGNHAGSIIYDECENSGAVYDTIVDAGTNGASAYYVNNCGDPQTQNHFVPWSENSIYHDANNAHTSSLVGSHCTGNTAKQCRRQSDCLSGEGFCQEYNIVATCGAPGTCFTYSSSSGLGIPGFLRGGGNLLGSAYDPKFVNVSTTNCDVDFQTAITTDAYRRFCDFHLQTASPAIDAGTTYYLLAAAAGSNATTIPVTGSGPNGGPPDPPLYQWGPGFLNWPNGDHPHRKDPRMYFVAPNSFWRADKVPGADVIQIKGATCQNAASDLGSAERARLVSMTATSITVDRPCTWPLYAGIHRPWSGAAPDMGAFEFGSSSQTGLAPPALISVNPITN